MSDTAAHEAVPTQETVTALLRHFDWGPTAKLPGKYEVWTRLGSPDEVLVPLDPNRGDFGSLLDRAFRTVMLRDGAEASRVLDLLKVKVSSVLDSTQWCKQTSVDAGLISWGDGEALYTAAKTSLMASARATYAKRMLHGSSGSHLAKRFLERTLMGQTEIGSFVITAHTPAQELFHVSKSSETQSRDDYRKAETVTGRTILDTLQRSLDAVRQGLDEYKSAPTLDTFIPLVEDGVSFELIDALATLTRGGDAAVTVEHAATSNQPKPARLEVAFDSVESAVLEKVASRYKASEPPQTVRLTGEVGLLENSTTSPIHLIRLDVMEGAEVRHARVRLSPDQYELAVEAHRTHRWMAVSGQLEKDGRSFWLYGADRLSLLDGPESMSVPMEATSEWIEATPLALEAGSSAGDSETA